MSKWVEELAAPHELFQFKSDPGVYREATSPEGNRVFLWWSRYYQQWLISSTYRTDRDVPIIRIPIKPANTWTSENL